MADLTLTQPDCDSIRKAIDIRLTIIDIPDTTILLDIYAGYACRRIQERLPTGFNDVNGKAKAACIYSCAALLIPAIKQISTERIAGHEKTFKFFDWDKKIADLEARINEIVDSLIDANAGSNNSTAVRPLMFGLAKANRADRP